MSNQTTAKTESTVSQVTFDLLTLSWEDREVVLGLAWRQLEHWQRMLKAAQDRGENMGNSLVELRKVQQWKQTVDFLDVLMRFRSQPGKEVVS